MGTKMSHAPVYFTIAQVRFNPILTLDSYAPQIQETLRKEGFPDAQKGHLATINFSLSTPTESSAPQIPLAQTSRYIFCNMDRTSGFILDQGALSFQTTEYDVFETFSAKFLKGLQAVDQAINLTYTDRIGLRYLDAIFPKSAETLGDYLSGSMLGVTEKLQDTVVHAFSETLVKLETINVRSRVVIQDGEVRFPPDLQALMLNILERFRQLRGRHAIMDSDGWFDLRQAFDLEHIREQLILVRGGIEKVFRASITENALKVWK
jgi:uncharacterized protein (TIGR04255 family)